MRVAGDELGSKTIELCDVHDGHLYYLGLLGTDHCAEYSVTASYFTPWKLWKNS